MKIPPSYFGHRLHELTIDRKTPLCMGIDPHIDLIPSFFGPKDSIQTIKDFTFACINVADGKIPAIKFQTAFYEMYGAKGLKVLAKASKFANERHITIMDAKKGDIKSTSEAIAKAWLGHLSPFQGDALTINPYLGLDCIEVFVKYALERGCGLFILLRTSNPGAEDFQDAMVGDMKLYEYIATKIKPFIKMGSGLPHHSWSSIGIVMGGTQSKYIKEVREILGSAPALVLIPGFGEQGGGVETLQNGLIKRGKDRPWIGGLINSSRGLIFPPEAKDIDNLTDWYDCLSANIEKSIQMINEVQP